MTKRQLPSVGRGVDLEDYRGRHLWLLVICLVVFTAIGLRLWQLQIVDGDDYYRASTENIVREVEDEPPRGEILDRNGMVLAENRPSFDVVVNAPIFRSKAGDETYDLLEEYLHLSRGSLEDFRERVESENGEIVLRRDIARSDVARLQEDQMRLPGVEVRTGFKRYYPLHHVGAHTLGYVGQIGSSELQRLRSYGYRPGHLVGRMGLEKSFEELLHGSPGLDREVVDARGNPVGEAEEEFLIGEYQEIEAIPGRDLTTNLDAELMVIIDEAIEEYAAGGVVAVDPDDGSVLAMYSKPHFNPNAWSGRLSMMERMRIDSNPFRPMTDKTVSGFFPGSVFKFVGTWMGLAEGMVEPDDEYHCPGHYTLGGHRFRCWRDRGHGDVDAYSSMERSCDVYYYELADATDIDTIASYARRFGYGEKTGIELSHESAGRVPDRTWHTERSPDGYQRGFDLNTIIGQGDTLATPLQVAMSYAAIANGGDLYYPQLVDDIRNDDGRILYDYEPEIRRRVDIDPHHLEVIRQGLHDVVQGTEGTARTSALDDVEVAGKTGTAQVAEIGEVRIPNEERELHLRNHAWFAAYAPFDDPEIALVVFLEHGGGGGGDAAPVAMEILERYLGEETGDALDVRLGDRVTYRGGEP